MVKYRENYSLKDHNTFGFEVRASLWAAFQTETELREIINRCRNEELNWRVIGGGSNIVFSRDFQGMLIHPIGQNIERVDGLIVVDAGVEWDRFVEWSVVAGLSGVENLSYIPGSVGAAPVQNIGAYGVEVKDCLEWVEYFDPQTMSVVRIKAEDCEFGYRDSIFKKSLSGRAIVIKAAFRLTKQLKFKVDYGNLQGKIEQLGGATLSNIRQAVIDIRRDKLPDPKDIGSAGSFFKNPVISDKHAQELASKCPEMPQYQLADGFKVPAGWLIDRAGWRGHVEGRVGVHLNQALVLVNYGGALPSEIINLSEKIVADIEKKYNIVLEKEVVIW